MPSFLSVAALACVIASTCIGGPSDGPLPGGVRQLVVSIGADWNAARGQLQCFERAPLGKWRVSSTPLPVLFGRHGLAWGRGVRGLDEPGPRKSEGDGRAPAGVFVLGRVFGHTPAAPAGAGVDYLQITDRDAWIDDPANPNYNRHVRIPAGQPLPAWFKSQRMRVGDPAHRWLVEVRHNADPPEPGLGSAIFLHIRRGPNRTSSGCTTMAPDAIEWMIGWLRPESKPHYVLLPRAEYLARWQSWGLPGPDQVGALLE